MSFDQYIARQTKRYGDRLNVGGLPSKFRRYYGKDVRIKVRTIYPDGSTYVRTGIVCASSGWAPTFLLMHRANSVGSSDTLSERDEIVAIKRGSQYVPTEGYGPMLVGYKTD